MDDNQAPSTLPTPDGAAKQMLQMSAEDFKKMTDAADRRDQETKEFKQRLDELEAQNAKLGSAAEAKDADLQLFKDMMESRHGKSGREDLANEMGKFVTNTFNKVHPMGDRKKVDPQFAKDHDTQTDATSGYLVPDYMAKEIYDLSDVYGKIIDRVSRFQLDPGSMLKLNREAASPISHWRTTALRANNEGGTITDETNASFGQIEREPVLLGHKYLVTNELLKHPAIGFGAMMAKKSARSLVIAREDAIIRGADTDTAGDPPSDGLIIDSSITDLTDLAANTMANYLAFIGEAAAAYGPFENIDDNVIMLHTTKFYGLVGETVNASNAAFIWSDPLRKTPTMMWGYEVIFHQAMYDLTNYHVAIGALDALVEVNSGKVSIGFNEWGDGWDTNETSVRVFTHSNYGVWQPAVWRRAQYV